MKHKNKLWVVDLGEAYTKIIKSSVKEPEIVNVENFWIEKTPRHVWDENFTLENKALAFFLKPFFKEHKKSDELMLIVAQRDVKVITYTFPMMNQSEVKAAIEWKLRLLMSEQFENCRIDYLAKERIDRYEYLGFNQKKLDVTGVAVEKEKLLAYEKVFKMTRHRLDLIVPMFHVYSVLGEKNDCVSLIVDMGKSAARLYYFAGGALVEEKTIKPKKGWDGQTYLWEIIKNIQVGFNSSVTRSRNHESEEILIIGGESLHKGVVDFLEKGLNRKVSSTLNVLEMRKFINFSSEVTNVETCLLLPGLCGILKWAKLKGTVFENEKRNEFVAR